jgi:hypothetical protein
MQGQYSKEQLWNSEKNTKIFQDLTTGARLPTPVTHGKMNVEGHPE